MFGGFYYILASLKLNSNYFGKQKEIVLLSQLILKKQWHKSLQGEEKVISKLLFFNVTS